MKKTEINIKIDPRRVYKKNWYAALTFLSREPHTPINKNIGISNDSKKI